MKVRVTLKDPDTMSDSVDAAIKRLPRPDGVDPTEWASLLATRADRVRAHISSRWMQYGEYLEVEFDTEADTATVVPIKK